MTQITEHKQGELVLRTGALIRPKTLTLGEERYAFAPGAAGVPRADPRQPHLLPSDRLDPRPPIGYQQLGDCAQWTASQAAQASYNRVNNVVIPHDQSPHPGVLYENARKMHGITSSDPDGWFPDDTGSFPADGLDLMLRNGGAYAARSDHRYVADARFDYPNELDSLTTTTRLVAAHRAIYPDQRDALELLCTALEMGFAVMISMMWPRPFFSPDASGALPRGVRYVPQDGAHAVYCWGWKPDTQHLLCQNQYSDGWNPQAARVGWFCRAGDFLVPVEYLSNGTIFELRAVEPIQASPTPEPEPFPQPHGKVFAEAWDSRDSGRTWSLAGSEEVQFSDAPMHAFTLKTETPGDGNVQRGGWYYYKDGNVVPGRGTKSGKPARRHRG